MLVRRGRRVLARDDADHGGSHRGRTVHVRGAHQRRRQATRRRRRRSGARHRHRRRHHRVHVLRVRAQHGPAVAPAAVRGGDPGARPLARGGCARRSGGEPPRDRGVPVALPARRQPGRARGARGRVAHRVRGAVPRARRHAAHHRGAAVHVRRARGDGGAVVDLRPPGRLHRLHRRQHADARRAAGADRPARHPAGRHRDRLARCARRRHGHPGVGGGRAAHRPARPARDRVVRPGAAHRARPHLVHGEHPVPRLRRRVAAAAAAVQRGRPGNRVDRDA